jgi:hypothetical protein
MTKINFTAYPKPWEIALSKMLSLPLGVAQIGVLIYIVVLLFSHIIWGQILILAAIELAIGFCYRSVAALLERVKDANDSSGK